MRASSTPRTPGRYLAATRAASDSSSLLINPRYWTMPSRTSTADQSGRRQRRSVSRSTRIRRSLRVDPAAEHDHHAGVLLGDPVLNTDLMSALDRPCARRCRRLANNATAV